MTTAAEIRTWNPTMQRLHLMEHGWVRGRNQSDWRHPGYPGRHTLAAAVRQVLETEER